MPTTQGYEAVFVKTATKKKLKAKLKGEIKTYDQLLTSLME